jgi:excinuclease ABC subunit B
VAVLDADKEGFLRSESTLIQICGRAARNVDGRVIFYADVMTGSMQRALSEMNRRRKKQIEYNKKNNIEPKTIIKAVHDLDEFQNLSRQKSMTQIVEEEKFDYIVTPKNIDNIIKELESQMKDAAENLDFETAAVLRDKMLELKNMKSGSLSSREKRRKKN